MDYYYFYRMTNDTGNAPCVFEGNYKPSDLLTLACCKGGQFRKGKPIQTGLRCTIGKAFQNKNYDDNIYVIGILKDRILYAAKIDSTLKMTDYFRDEKYKKRMDCIYECKAWTDSFGKGWELTRRGNFNPYFHGEKSGFDTVEKLINQNNRDELGEYVLLSTNFVYTGNNRCLLPIDDYVKDYMPKHQETKLYTYSNDISNSASKQIAVFVKKCFEAKYISSEPNERLGDKCTSKGCKQK